MGKYEIKFTRKASEDIVDIGDYITYVLLEPDTSYHFIKGLKQSILQLSYFPRTFPVVQDEEIKKKDIRCMPYKNYYIFYQIMDDRHLIIILRVG